MLLKKHYIVLRLSSPRRGYRSLSSERDISVRVSCMSECVRSRKPIARTRTHRLMELLSWRTLHRPTSTRARRYFSVLNSLQRRKPFVSLAVAPLYPSYFVHLLFASFVSLARLLSLFFLLKREEYTRFPPDAPSFTSAAVNYDHAVGKSEDEPFRVCRFSLLAARVISLRLLVAISLVSHRSEMKLGIKEYSIFT